MHNCFVDCWVVQSWICTDDRWSTLYSHSSHNSLLVIIIISSHSGVETHFDGSDFTWSLMLSPRDNYEGGGTYIRCLQQTLRLQQGQVLLHPGALFHAGADITAGCREYVCCCCCWFY